MVVLKAVLMVALKVETKVEMMALSSVALLVELKVEK
jgi:hypothetical protein